LKSSSRTETTFEWSHSKKKTVKTMHKVLEPGEAGPCDESKMSKAGSVAVVAGRSEAAKKRSAVVVADPEVTPLWDRIAFRNDEFQLRRRKEEHACFSGFENMLESTGRCQGVVRESPPVGTVSTWINWFLSRTEPLQLRAVVAGFVNVWVPQGLPKATSERIMQAMEVYANANDSPSLRPDAESSSWVERACNVFGQLPFMYTCSPHINAVWLECGEVNAAVFPFDLWGTFPPTTPDANEPFPNRDNTFYMCLELFGYHRGNPYFLGMVAAHETAHVIQLGFGMATQAMTEGAATWLESDLISQPARPLYWLGGVPDWNYIQASNIYTSRFGKFYQFHSILLTYLAQEGVLGLEHTAALQLHRVFDEVPFGRGVYDYYLGQAGKPTPKKFVPIELDLKSTSFPLAEALLNWRVAIAASCIEEPDRRPKEPRYLLPKRLQDHPWWDCSTLITFRASERNSVENVDAIRMDYGGAAIYRLASPANASISLAVDADALVRTKILAAGDGAHQCAEVKELRPGETAHFPGHARDIYVVQVNVDPEGEVLSPESAPAVWRVSDNGGSPAWFAGGPEPDTPTPNSAVEGLRSPEMFVPDGAKLEFHASWHLEDLGEEGPFPVQPSCAAKGYDGVQVRVLAEEADGQTSVTVVEPADGYGLGEGGASAVFAFGLYVYGFGAPCASLSGWTGAGGSLNAITVPLEQFAGKKIRFEFLFASDQSVGGGGFLLSGTKVVDGAGGVVYEEDLANPTMTRSAYPMPAPQGGSVREYSGVPVVAGYPKGYWPDEGFRRGAQERRAAWSASWSKEVCAKKKPALRGSFLGWSYRSFFPSRAFLAPGEELCVRLRAPFAGVVSAATLFSLRLEVGVAAINITLREPSAPFAPLGAPLHSPSPGVLDPASHRVLLENGPLFWANDDFLFCVAVVGDGRGNPDEQYLTLPLVDIGENASSESGNGGTIFFEVAGGPATQTNPYEGHTLVARAAFEQCPSCVRHHLCAATCGEGLGLHGPMLDTCVEKCLSKSRVLLGTFSKFCAAGACSLLEAQDGAAALLDGSLPPEEASMLQRQLATTLATAQVDAPRCLRPRFYCQGICEAVGGHGGACNARCEARFARLRPTLEKFCEHAAEAAEE